MSEQSVNPYSLSAEEISEYAKQIHGGHAMASWQINPNDLGMVFMPLLLGGFPDPEKTKEFDLQHCIGVEKDALPRGVNGYPMYTSVRFLTRADCKTIHEKVLKIIEVMGNI